MTPMEFLIEAAKVYPSEPVWLVRLDFLGWILFSCWRNPSKNLVTLHMCIYVYIYIYILPTSAIFKMPTLQFCGDRDIIRFFLA